MRNWGPPGIQSSFFRGGERVGEGEVFAVLILKRTRSDNPGESGMINKPGSGNTARGIFCDQMKESDGGERGTEGGREL